MRPSIIVVVLSMLAASGGLAYLHSTREQDAAEPARSSETRTSTAKTGQAPAPTAPLTNTADADTDAVSQTAPSADEVSSTETAAPASKTIAQWIKDTESEDPKVRAAAIAALANAPKEQAMPALERVLETGEPNVDRHIALRSMHSLALSDGDRNGQIRDVIRGAIYHGDDDGVTQTAQSLLDDIEAEFTQRELDANKAREQ